MCQQLYYKILRPNLLGHNYTYKQYIDLAKAKSEGSIYTYVLFKLLKTKNYNEEASTYANPENHISNSITVIVLEKKSYPYTCITAPPPPFPHYTRL